MKMMLLAHINYFNGKSSNVLTMLSAFAYRDKYVNVALSTNNLRKVSTRTFEPLPCDYLQDMVVFLSLVIIIIIIIIE